MRLCKLGGGSVKALIGFLYFQLAEGIETLLVHVFDNLSGPWLLRRLLTDSF